MIDYKEEVYRLIWDAEAASRAIEYMTSRYGIRLANHHAFIIKDNRGENRMAVCISMHRDTMPKTFLTRLKLWCKDFLNGETFQVKCTGGLVIVNITAPAPPADVSVAIFNRLEERAKVTANGEIRARLKRALGNMT
jgi:hypothetical protein